MSWLSSAIKKLKKVQPGKVIVNAANSAIKAIPVVGGIVGGLQGAVDQAKQNQADARQTVGAGGIGQTVQNINAASTSVVDMKKYLLWGALGIGVILLIIFIKKG